MLGAYELAFMADTCGHVMGFKKSHLPAFERMFTWQYAKQVMQGYIPTLGLKKRESLIALKERETDTDAKTEKQRERHTRKDRN